MAIPVRNKILCILTLATGDYNVCLTVSNGLTATACKTVNVVIINVVEPGILEDLVVGPNPAASYVNFQFDKIGAETYVVEVVNPIGQTVFQQPAE